MPYLIPEFRQQTELSHLQVVLSTGETSDPILLTHKAGRVSVAVHPQGEGSARVELTLSPPEWVEIDAALWVPWGDGNVQLPTADVLDGPVTAVRGVAIGGAATFEVVVAPDI